MYKKILKTIENEIIEYERLIQDMLTKVVNSFKEKDIERFKYIKDSMEPESDRIELKIEEHCIEIIARFSPKGSDLREIMMISRMADNLERIGDHIENICESGIYLLNKSKDKNMQDLVDMGVFTKKMIKKSLEAFIDKDSDKALSVLKLDDELDYMNKDIFPKTLNIMKSDVDFMRSGMQIIRCAHNFERIGDSCTNLCEDIIYIKNGVVVRHKNKTL